MWTHADHRCDFASAFDVNRSTILRLTGSTIKRPPVLGTRRRTSECACLRNGFVLWFSWGLLHDAQCVVKQAHWSVADLSHCGMARETYKSLGQQTHPTISVIGNDGIWGTAHLAIWPANMTRRTSVRPDSTTRNLPS
jgi:hypothetical protein